MTFTSTSAEIPRPAMPVATSVTEPPAMLRVESHFIHVAYEGSPSRRMVLPVAATLTFPLSIEITPLLFIPFEALPATFTSTSEPLIIIFPADFIPLTKLTTQF